MSKGGGGNQAATEAQNKYNEKMWQIDRQEMIDAAAYQKETFDINVWNQQAQIDFKNKTALAEWADEEAMRIFDYNNQIDAYNASKKTYNQQLEFNDFAQELQLDDNNRKYQERLTDIGFQNEDILMKLQFGQDAFDLKKRGIDLDFKNALGEIGLSLDAAQSEAELSGKALALQLKGEKQDIARKGEEAKIASLHEEGKIRNLGQAGRTASKNMQTMFAKSGRADAALHDLLTSSESKYNLDVEKVANSLHKVQKRGQHGLGMAKGKGLLSMDQIAGELLNQVKTTKFSQRQLNESLKSAGAQWEADQAKSIFDRLTADFAAQDRLAAQPMLRPQKRPPYDLPYPKVQAPPGVMSDARWQETKPPEGVAARGPGFLSQALGIAGSIASIFKFSDDRLKYDINRIGTSPQGIPEYTFRYRFDGEHGPKYKGTSAQDLIEMGRTDAIGTTEKDGFYYVDYSKLDVEFEKVTAT